MMAVASYLEKYFECVEAMPLGMQRRVSEMMEMEQKMKGVLDKLKELQRELEAMGPGEEVAREVMIDLQHCLCKFRDVGDEKLAIASVLLDTAEGYTQQLALRAKDLDNPRTVEDLHHPRHTHSNHHTNSRGDSSLSTVLSLDLNSDKPLYKRNYGTKRPRPLDKGEEEVALKENGGRSRENSTSNGAAPGKPPKKKPKVKKRAVTKEASTPSSGPSSSQLPMPDLTSQPLDPNEPTYCLCNQVSFGEMIGCDNEECQIEWFHFQCVGLTSKPKGKWYCPQCSRERKQRNSKPN